MGCDGMGWDRTGGGTGRDERNRTCMAGIDFVLIESWCARLVVINDHKESKTDEDN